MGDEVVNFLSQYELMLLVDPYMHALHSFVDFGMIVQPTQNMQ